ncbi:RHS repeat protein [Streptomyces sp. NBC_00237]|uniref:RHS repeat domain-containing protein n=1 Tax=Streptomyces sp. NBC_00237 TaxID=2975687 RepID=UPI002259FF8E|nr:RHS repeat-associated core domain-containing protein [Streptomyces sp. NBC_00237]MCX5205928.1 RHS repeat protein [Streptomyces sp. NBC_00237]
MAGAVLLGLLATLLGTWPAEAAERALIDFKIRQTQKEKSVPGTAVPTRGSAADPMKGKDYKPVKAAWPTPGTAEVELAPAAAPATAGRLAAAPRKGTEGDAGLKKAGALPVRIGRLTGGPAAAHAAARATPAPSPEALAAPTGRAPAQSPTAAATPGNTDPVGVSVLDQQAAQRAGVNGLLVRLESKNTPDPTDVPAAKSAPGTVRVELDYSAFAQAYGGDWASRLTLFQLDDTDGKSTPKAVPIAGVKNDTKARTVTADVPLAFAAPRMLAMAASAAGDGGSFTASSLSASQAWSEGGASGAFTYSYPIETPESPAGDGPDIALSYNSQSVDGRTSAANTQASWVGDGWDFSTGFVERSYKACSEDMGNGANNTAKTGDLCWGPDTITLSLGGSSSQLVKDEKTGVYRPTHDSGEKVERLTGAANGADGGEYWKVTTADGTQYVFGQNRLPGWSTGKPETNSAWTVPVAGNHKDEPGYTGTFANSFKTQAWRWNLDYVVDTQGNTSTYWYTPERNNYGRNNGNTGVSYVRGGYLNTIRYGQKSDQQFTANAPAEVVFTTAERCLPATGVDCDPAKLTKTTAKNWPDVPFDQICADGAQCTTQKSPAFFTRKRLTDITTRVLVGSAYKDVDTYKLDQGFPETGDGMPPPLWLKSVTRTGKDGAAVSLPPVTFTGEQRANRVDGLEGLAPMVRWRVASIKTEAGGIIGATYSAAECTPATLPDAAANGKRCYPVYWAKDGAEKPTLDWFHKYVVTRVVETDTTGGAPAKETSYDYVGAPAWRFDENEMIKPEHRTWNQWRGYGKVRTLTGTKGQVKRSLAENVYFRGMDGDRTASGGTRAVKVADSEGREVLDADALAGTVRESLTYDGEDGKPIGASSSDPWVRGPTASRPRAGLPPLTSWMTATAETRGRALGEGDTWIRTRQSTTYNDRGLAVQVEDAGDLSTTADDLCTRTTYVENAAKWWFDDPERVETVSVACGATAERPRHVVTDTVNVYDEFGNVTEVKGLKEYADGKPVYKTATKTTYDIYGRPLSQTDGGGNVSRTDYAPATGANPVRTTQTDVLGHVTTLEINPTRDLPLSSVDANGKRTDATYDALGRTQAVWAPGRAKDTATPSTKYTYEMAQDKPSVVTSENLRDDGTYAVSKVLYDALLRERQSQIDATGGGRVNEDSVYDSRGQMTVHNGPYWNDQPVSNALLKPNDNEMPRAVGFTYDGAGRQTASVLYSKGTEKQRTTTAYTATTTTVVPPAGGTVVTTVNDVRGRAVERRQYRGAGPTGAFDATKYTYTPGGDLSTITDSAGNTWSNAYDIAGNLVRTTDPDTGTSTMTYDDEGQLASSTDARGKKVSYTYDIAGRKTAEYQGGTDGTKIASWTYDTLAKGLQTSSTRFEKGRAYTQEVLGYNDDYTPTGTTTTVPAEETGLAGTYTTKYGYTTTGQLAWEQYEAKGGLKAERVAHTYTADGLPYATTGGGLRYVQETGYSPYGEVTQLVQGSAGGRVSTTTQYDEANRRAERSTVDREVAGGMNTEDTTYRYDPMGNVLGINSQRDNNPLAQDNQCFRYDYLGRTTEAWTAKAACTATPEAAPKTADVGGIAPYWHSYAYDLTGNRTSRTTHDTAGDTAKDVKETYTYNAPGTSQPHALKKVTATGGRTGESAFDYDESGNTTRIVRPELPKGQSLTWDDQGNLVAADTEGNTSSYTYDAGGSQLVQRGPQGITLDLGDEQFTWDPVAKKLRGTRYYAHSGDVVAVRTALDDGSTPVSYVLEDHHGTNVTQIDADGLGVIRRTLDEFGNEREKTSLPWMGNRGFVGGTQDRTTGLTQLGARPYDPDTGRFISADPVLDSSSPQQLNAYQYANNAPATLSDPEGLWWGSDLFNKAKKKVTRVVHKATNWVAKKIVAPVVKKAKQVYHKYVPKKIQKIVRSVKKATGKAWQATKRWVKTKAWPAVKRAGSAVKRYVVAKVKVEIAKVKWATAFAGNLARRAPAIIGEAAAVAGGMSMMTSGAGMAAGGIGLSATGGGAVAGVPAVAGGAAVGITGGVVAWAGISGLGSDIGQAFNETKDEMSGGGGSSGSSWQDEFKSLPRGDQGHVRTQSSVEDLRGLFDKWTAGGKRLPARGEKIPDRYELEDGTVMQWRKTSKSQGETIDISKPGSKKDLKVHIKHGD